MRAIPFLRLMALVLGLSSSSAQGQIQRCATPDPAQVVYDNQSYRIGGSTAIPVVFHVIYKSDSTGYVSESVLQSQIDTMNAAHSRSGSQFSFYLAAASWTENNNWHDNMSRGSQAEQNMTDSLAVDPKHAFNIYICGIDPYLGWVINFPWDVSESSNQNGVILHFGSLPGGYISNYNEGDTGTHEAGHYLGLYHTFQNGCTSPGDEVEDTPYHMTNTGCPSPFTNTCTGQPGYDPIHNYMNYTNDPCMTELTSGQNSRMASIVGQYKPNLGGTTLEFASDFTVFSGQTWRFYGGSTLKFASGKKLQVYGTLVAVGTSSNRITFTSASASPAKGDWKFIKFENSSVDADCIIKFANIEYAQYGVKCYYASPKIENNIITNNRWGIYLEHSSPYIATNEIKQNDIGILIASTSSPSIIDNLISLNTDNGIHLYQSSPSFFDNSIKSNTNYGVYVFFYSSPEFGPTSGSGRGLNVISNNGITGINGYRFATPFLGSSSFFGIRIGGYNSVYSNTSYNVHATDNSDVEAEYNYWGADPPPSGKFYADGTSSIDYKPYLRYYPGGGSSLGKSIVATGEGDWPELMQFEPDTNSVSSLRTWAHDLWLAGKLVDAISVYKMIVRKFPNAPEAPPSLVRVAYLYQKSGLTALPSYLASVDAKEHRNELLSVVARDLLRAAYLDEREFDNAIQTSQYILARSPDTASEYMALVALFNIYHHELGDEGQATESLALLKARYPDYLMTLAARYEMGEEVDWSLAKHFAVGDMPLAKEVPIPDKFSLGANYPNPFNPATTIRYDLPKSSRVTLTIYDIMGREVYNHAAVEEAGYRSITWRGRNKAGRTLPSGIYIYRFVAAPSEDGVPYVATRKMLLLK